MAELTLVSFDLCPFVQRSVIALREKQVEHDVRYIDLANKPDWFLAISPHGRVPVLLVGDTPLFESLVLLEYLDETREPRLHPEDALLRARDRAWFSVVEGVFGAGYRMMVAPDEDTLQAQARAAREVLAKLEPELQGPLWRGNGFCAMDAVAAPGLQRLAWVEALRPDLDLFAGTPKVATWWKELSQRDSVRGSTVPDIRDRFLAYLAAHDSVLTA